jgi:hypothetical protein
LIQHEIYEFGPYVLDSAQMLLRRDGSVVPLQPRNGCGRVVEAPAPSRPIHHVRKKYACANWETNGENPRMEAAAKPEMAIDKVEVLPAPHCRMGDRPDSPASDPTP